MHSNEGVSGADRERQRAWRIAGMSVIVLILLAFVLFQPTVRYLLSLWNQYDTGNYAHGYLVLAISVYLIFANRRKLATLTPRPSYLALPALLVASLLWLMAAMVDVSMMQAVALLLLVLFIVWAVLGKRVTAELAFPILFIGFAIPVWFPLSPVLQDLTADAVFWVIRSIGVPAAREQNIIMLPAGTFSVEEECSGLRYTLAALTLGTLYAYLNYQNPGARIIVVLISAAAGVLANMLRVFIVVYLGYKTDMQHPYVYDHLMLGWYLFGALVVLLLFVDVRIHRRNQGQVDPGEASGKQAPRSDQAAVESAVGSWHFPAVVFASVLMLSVGPAAAFILNSQPDTHDQQVDPDLPVSSSGWKSQPGADDDWMPVYHGASIQKLVYRKRDDSVILYSGCYTAQQQGKELINDINRISDGKVWKTGYPRARLHTIGDGRHSVLEQLLEASHGERRLVWYWYRVAGRITTSDYEAKVLQLLGRITGQNLACIVAVSTDIDDERTVAVNRLAEFMSEPEIIEIGAAN